MANPLPSIFVTGPNFRQLSSIRAIQLDPNGMLYESSADNLTAHAGGGQANALPLTNELNRISVVATAGDSVMLPPSTAGLTIYIENAASLPIQVYGYGTDTINNTATATGVSHMNGSVCIYTCYTAGSWFVNGLGSGYAGSFATSSWANGLVAHAGGGQANATPLTAMVNYASTVATAADSFVLPASASGMVVTLINNGGNSCNVFAPSGSTMQGTLNGSVSLSNANIGIYYCIGTAWFNK